MDSCCPFQQSRNSNYSSVIPFTTISLIGDVSNLLKKYSVVYRIIKNAFFHLRVLKNLVICFTLIGIIGLCTIVFADQEVIGTSSISYDNQLTLDPINMLLDLGEIGYATAFIMNRDGIPIEGTEIEINTEETSIITIETDSIKTNESGISSFTITGNQEGDSLITVSNGKTSSQIHVTVRRLKHYVLPYFFGNMQLSIINPTENTNYIKIQFHENSDRPIPAIVEMLDQKEMKTVQVSKKINIEIVDGWVEIFSTNIACGGVWTNKGFLPFYKTETVD